MYALRHKCHHVYIKQLFQYHGKKENCCEQTGRRGHYGGAMEEEMATHSSILAWRIPRTEAQRVAVRHNCVTQQQQQDGAKDV